MLHIFIAIMHQSNQCKVSLTTGFLKIQVITHTSYLSVHVFFIVLRPTLIWEFQAIWVVNSEKKFQCISLKFVKRFLISCSVWKHKFCFETWLNWEVSRREGREGGSCQLTVYTSREMYRGIVSIVARRGHRGRHCEYFLPNTDITGLDQTKIPGLTLFASFYRE